MFDYDKTKEESRTQALNHFSQKYILCYSIQSTTVHTLA